MAKTQKQEKVEIEETVVEVQASSWKGKDLSYLILFESGIDKWINSSDCASIEYSATLEKFYLSIVEEIEKSLVDILIQRQHTEYNLYEIQQSTINNLWEIIIDWIEAALKNSCGKRKQLNVSDIFWTHDLKAQKNQRMIDNSYIVYKRYCFL